MVTVFTLTSPFTEAKSWHSPGTVHIIVPIQFLYISIVFNGRFETASGIETGEGKEEY